MAKLIDILARDFEEWPVGCKAITQDSDGYVVSAKDCDVDCLRFDHNAWSGEGGNYMEIHELADDHKIAIITCAEWQAAVDALNAPKVVYGLPAIGSQVFVYDPEGVLRYGQGEDGEVVAHVENTAVIRMSYGLGCFEARCLRTAEQVAAEEREKAILEMASTPKPCGHALYNVCADLYDAGYRKQ